jgi:TonB family protein
LQQPPVRLSFWQEVATIMRPLQLFVFALILAGIAACSVVDLEPDSAHEQAFGKPKPEFPMSEYSEGREGWVLLGYTVSRAGLVMDVGVIESSGNEAFDQAAIDAGQHWRFAPGEQRQQKVLMNFVYDRSVPRLSRRFMSINESVHELIDAGDLDGAEELLAELRSDTDLGVVDLAYSYLTEGRIAGERGDYAGQLALFRKAIRNDGHWLARVNYLAALRAIIIMEIDLQDYASALRDYELLTQTSAGRKLARDLEDVVRSIDAALQEQGLELQPFMVADYTVSVVREQPKWLSEDMDSWGQERRTPTVRPSSPPPTRPPRPN